MGLADIKADIPVSVTLVAVTKSRTAEEIQSLLEQGHRVFGENRVQEAAEKFPALREKFPDIELHFIGHLQTNKAKDAVRLFDVIETVDSTRLAEELSKEMKKQKRDIPCFIQVNTGNEDQKGGVTPENLDGLFRFCTGKAQLLIEGLMCIPPTAEPPDAHFALLQKRAKKLGLKKLSMGMSGDFKTAIRYGATHVRIGSALFDIK